MSPHAFFTLHHGLSRQGLGSDTTPRRLLIMAAPLPTRPRVLDLGCGPRRAASLVATEAAADVTVVDTHQPLLGRLAEAADRSVPAMPEAVDPARREIEVRRAYGR